MNNTVEKFTVGKCNIKIAYDQDAENPREWDNNLGKMVCWHRRHNLGDEQPRNEAGEYLMELARDSVSSNYPDSLLEANRDKILDTHFTILPLYLYDHSGITMSTGAFSCPWDSGQVGFIYVSLSDALKEHSLSKGDWKTKVKYDDKTISLRDNCKRVLNQEVETYDEFLTGQVYGFIVETQEGDHLDSCWGFFGLQFCKDEATSVAEFHSKRINETELQTQLSDTMP